MKKKLLFILNEGSYFVSHRLPIAIAARDAGYEIHMAAREPTAPQEVINEGFFYHPIPLSRSGRNFFSELVSLIAMYRLMNCVKPDIVHLVTIKPVIYGSIAARLARIPAVVAAISGLGYVFIEQHFEARILKPLIIRLYRIAFKHKNVKVIFQNIDDEKTLLSVGALKKSQSALIRGSGVNLKHYYHSSEPPTPPLVVVMAARLLRDKGVMEYVEAAALVRAKGVNARFWLAGQPDPGNPSSVDEKQLKMWAKNQVIEYLGYCPNIADLFSQVHLVVLPSYREGLPRVLAEAAACGRAVVTTDVPGCRAAIIPEKTGLLAQARDSISLANAIHHLLTDHSRRNAMGVEGRKLAERAFDIKAIVEQHLQIYHLVSKYYGVFVLDHDASN